ncbi:MAG: DUF1800 domain-containing protein [Chloroflexi bacterium]|nr:DUF1800 domain-containing protein [Chloroflexota bacterium]MEB2367446.1 DUF1800 domain-containing protein [Chloroflexota bacterium]
MAQPILFGEYRYDLTNDMGFLWSAFRMDRRTFLKAMTTAAAAAAAHHFRWAGVIPVRAAQDTAAGPALHILNRATWGPTPADLAAINERGIAGWLDWQLDYESIPDPAIDAFLRENAILLQSYEELSAAATVDYGNVMNRFLWGRIIRAAFSTRQLYERMVEFWTDHFNVPAADLLTEKIIDDREVIRRHALGSFRDLLHASATSPAMLIYLDNTYSYSDHPNENYGRELLELHTLGVDGGYTERDVKEVARILTGWGVSDERWGYFGFNAWAHDFRPKRALGELFDAGHGIGEGQRLLDLLAAHPSTARFIAYKLVRYFVSDDPPQSLVDSTAQVFLATDGDIKSLLRHIFTSAEFYAHPGEKLRRPLEYLTAILRVLQPHLSVVNGRWLIWSLEQFDHLPYHWAPPDGYPQVSAAWLNTSALLARWNLAFIIPRSDERWYDGLRFDQAGIFAEARTVGEYVDLAAQQFYGVPISDADRTALIEFAAEGGGPDTPVDDDWRGWKQSSLLGLMLASPYFQWA